MRIENSIAAVILAAGYSSRAPGFKPLLPLGRSTVVENAIQIFRRAGITDITVVVGHYAEKLIPLLESREVKYVFNEFYQDGMYSSVVAGVRSLSRSANAFFLLPADMPLVKSHTVKLISRFYKKLKADIVYPVFQGERGHPPLIASRLIPAILHQNQPEGLRGLLQQYEGNSLEMEVIDEGVVMDLDTAQDYHHLFSCYHHREIPTHKECEAIFRKLGVAEPVWRHGQAVSCAAFAVANRLNQAGLRLNVGLIAAAALLHDVAKGRHNHARLGAKFMRKFGYLKVANIIENHTDFVFGKTNLIDETAVVYLADKLIQGERLVSIGERFKPGFAKYAEDNVVLPMINQRFLCTNNILAATEQIIGERLDTMLFSLYKKV